MVDLLGVFNQEIIESINEDFIDRVRDFEEMELIRDGAFLQINKAWPEIIEKLTLAPNGVSAIENLLKDYAIILQRYILMQRLTEIINDINKTADENIDNKEE